MQQAIHGESISKSASIKIGSNWLCYDIKARPFNDLASAVRHRGKPLPGFKPVLQLAMDELKTLGALCLWRACLWRWRHVAVHGGSVESSPNMTK